MIVELALPGILAAAALAYALGYRALRIPRPGKLFMPDGRWALLYRLAGGAHPTLVVLHPYTGDALTTAKYSGFLQAAIPRGFNVVVPEGVANQWRDSPDLGAGGIDDIRFIASLVERLVREGIADPQCVFIAGISNGGMMAFAVVAAHPDLFAGIGTISAGMPRHAFESCRPTKPIALVMINGDCDDVLPYRGGDVGSRDGFFRNIAGVEEAAALFARANGCDAKAKPRRTQISDGKRRVERIDWDCPANSAVSLVRIIGGGHDVIGWRGPLEAFLGLAPRGAATAAAIIDAFTTVSRSTAAA